MKEFRGTKGEWKAHLKGRLSSVKASDDEIKIAIMIGSEKYYDEDERDPKQESWISFRERTRPLRDKEKKEALANARLIAAAPELLSALKDCLSTLSGLDDTIEKISDHQTYYNSTRNSMKLAESAINKALGE